MRILFGITGGIAAYKAASAVRLLTEQGHDVKVLPTANALRFIGSATLEALSHNSVDPDLYTEVPDVKHIKLAQEAELVIVAPATASFIARYASGIADDLLLNVLLATKAKVVVAPAMHTEMWEHPATQENLAKLRARGVEVINPVSGRLTGKDSGVGRMAEPEDIVSAALAISTNGLDLLGKKIVIAAGGTQEAIDAVRFIGNSSSGKQGIALAVNARDRGAQVTLIAANIDLTLPSGVKSVRVRSTADLALALNDINEVDVVLMPVAVSDYKVAEPRTDKVHREEKETLDLHLVANPDLLRQLSAERAGRANPLLVGFAAEIASDESHLKELAISKLVRKGVDLIVANNVRGGAVFGADENAVVIVGKSTQISFSDSKDQVASVILDQVVQLLGV